MNEPKLHGWKQVQWNIASRRGFGWEEFEREWQRAADNPDYRVEFNQHYLDIGPHAEWWLRSNDSDGDMPEHLLGPGAPHCFLDDRDSVDGCWWPD